RAHRAAQPFDPARLPARDAKHGVRIPGCHRSLLRRDPAAGLALVAHRIDSLRAPLLITWQLTRDCDLACLHCCTDSAPGKRLPGELTAEEAMKLVDDIIRCEVPYVMLCGGEPLVVPHFMNLAEALGRAGVLLKIETNGQR